MFSSRPDPGIPVARLAQEANPSRKSVGTGRFSSPAFTLIELLVVIVILGILASLLLPTIARMQARARDVRCVATLRQIGLAIRLYANDKDDYIVHGYVNWPDKTWQARLEPYSDGAKRESEAYHCLRAARYVKTFGMNSYALSKSLGEPDSNKEPRNRFISLPPGRRLVLVTDQKVANNEYINIDHMVSLPSRPDRAFERSQWYRHDGKTHVLWTDLSVSPISEAELLKDIYNPSKSLMKYK